jgi:hypothetical protein
MTDTLDLGALVSWASGLWAEMRIRDNMEKNREKELQDSQ